MNEREHSGGTGHRHSALLLQSPGGIGEAVRSALQHLNRPDRLAGAAGVDARANAAELRASVAAAIEQLAGEPKGDQLWSCSTGRCPRRTHPGGRGRGPRAAVQHLPPGLARAIDARAYEALWSLEIGTARRPDEPTGTPSK